MLLNKWNNNSFQYFVSQCLIIYNYYVICGDQWHVQLYINGKVVHTYLQQRFGAHITPLMPVCLDSRQFSSPPLLLLLFVYEQQPSVQTPAGLMGDDPIF